MKATFPAITGEDSSAALLPYVPVQACDRVAMFDRVNARSNGLKPRCPADSPNCGHSCG